MTNFAYLNGVYNITPTPFHPDGSLDEASLATLTRFNIDKGVDGMTILGVMGETSKVTDAERDRISILSPEVTPDAEKCGLSRTNARPFSALRPRGRNAYNSGTRPSLGPTSGLPRRSAGCAVPAESTIHLVLKESLACRESLFRWPLPRR